MMPQLKERKWDLMEVGEEFGPVEVVITDHMIKSFAYAVDDYNPAYFVGLPGVGRIGHPTLLCTETRDVIRTAYDLHSGGSGLHTKNEAELFASPRLGQRIVITGRHADKYIKREKQYVVLEAEAKDEHGSIILRHRSTHLRGLRQGVAKTAAPAPVATGSAPTIAGSPMVEVASADTPVGAQLRPIAKYLTQEQMTVFAGTQGRNIHNDLETARAAGLATTVASGLQTMAYISEVMTHFCGRGWREGGKLAVAFISPVYLGDTVYASGQVKEKAEDPGGLRIFLEVWCENQAGTRVTVGTASGLVAG